MLLFKDIYSVSCSCRKVCIGEMSRSDSRLSEHDHCLRSILLSKFTFAEHQHETGHQAIFKNTPVIAAKYAHYILRKIREFVGIFKHSNISIDRDIG